jgi:hypothetical protein
MIKRLASAALVFAAGCAGPQPAASHTTAASAGIGVWGHKGVEHTRPGNTASSYVLAASLHLHGD